MITCPVCIRSFNDDTAYEQHCNSKSHKKKARSELPWAANLQKCAVCYKAFGTQEAHCGATHPVCNTCNVYVVTLQQHWNATASHPKCPSCNLGFSDTSTKERHQMKTHGYVSCTPCDRIFSPGDIETHWKTSFQHPQCVVCGIGCETSTSYHSHFQSEHNKLWCQPCSLPFQSDALLQQHYLSAPTHPKCQKCRSGFNQIADLDQHNATQHPPPAPVVPQATFYRCEACRRNFRQPAHLNAHYRDSAAHPTCEICVIGFIDSIAFEQHNEVHAKTSPESGSSTPRSTHVLILPSPKRAPIVEDSWSPNDDAAPRVPESAPTVLISPSTPGSAHDDLSHPSPRSDELELQQTRDIDPVHPSPRAISEPAPTLLMGRSDRPTIFLGTAGISPTSPTIAEEGTIVTQPFSAVSAQTLTYTSGPRSSISTPELIRTRSPSESSVNDPDDFNVSPTDIAGGVRPSDSQRSQQSSVHSLREITETNAPNSRSSSRASRIPSRLSTPVSHYDIVVSPATDIIARHGHRDMYTRSQAGSRLSMLSDYIPVSAVPGRAAASPEAQYIAVSPSISRSESRMSRSRTPQSRYGSADGACEPERLCRSDSRMEGRPETRLSRTSVTHIKQTSSALPSPFSGRPLSRASRSSITEEVSASTRVVDETPTPKAIMPQLPHIPVENGLGSSVSGPATAATTLTSSTKDSSWHCRVCLREPTEPTATMCGHLFCHGCIIQELARNFQCPVCRKTMLLRLHVDSQSG